MNRAKFPQEGRYFDLVNGDRLDLTQHWKLSYCWLENGDLVFKDIAIADPNEQGYLQEFTVVDGEIYIDGIAATLGDVPFWLINKGSRWYINILNRDGLLSVLKAAQKAHEDTGWVNTDHSGYIKWVKRYPADATDVEINYDWHTRDVANQEAT